MGVRRGVPIKQGSILNTKYFYFLEESKERKKITFLNKNDCFTSLEGPKMVKNFQIQM